MNVAVQTFLFFGKEKKSLIKRKEMQSFFPFFFLKRKVCAVFWGVS